MDSRLFACFIDGRGSHADDTAALQSVRRQLLLGGFGAVLLLWAFNSGGREHPTDDEHRNASVVDNASDALPPASQNSSDVAASPGKNDAPPPVVVRTLVAPSPSASVPRATAAATRHSAEDLEHAEAAVVALGSEIADNDADAASMRDAISKQSDLIARQQRNLDTGAGSPELRDQVRAVMEEARESIGSTQAQIDRWEGMRPEQLQRLETLKAERDRIRGGAGR